MTNDLRTSLIRLAHANPALRADLLPLLKEAGCEKLPEGGMRDNCEEKVEEGKKADKKAGGWAGWNTTMPVQVITENGGERFKNLAAAQKMYPELDPDRGGGGFYPAMRGEIDGRPAIRFEDKAAYKMYSMASKKASRTATKPSASVQDHIEDGLKAIVATIARDLDKKFPESIRFGSPEVADNMRVLVEGTVEWRPDPSNKGYIMVVFGMDPFDLRKGEISLTIILPSGKRFQKTFNAGSAWLDKSAQVTGSRFAEFLRGWIEDFFVSA